MARIESIRSIAQLSRNRERASIVEYLRTLAPGEAGAPFLEAAADLIEAGYHRPNGGNHGD